MARVHNFNGATRAIAGGVAETIQFTQSDVPSQNVVAYHVRLEGGSSLADITRIRVLQNGGSIVDLTPAQLIAYQNSFSVGACMEPATTDDRFTLPFYMADAPTEELQDYCQFPSNASVQIEINIAATAAAGTMVIGYTVTDQVPRLYPRILSQQINAPAGATNFRLNFSESGIIRGIFLPHAGLDRFKLVLGGQEITSLPSAAYLGAAGGDLLSEVERVNGIGQFVDPGFQRVSVEKPAPITSSYLEITTAVAWAGVANEAVLYALVPQAGAAA